MSMGKTMDKGAISKTYKNAPVIRKMPTIFFGKNTQVLPG
jgi:hypothetical protein